MESLALFPDNQKLKKYTNQQHTISKPNILSIYLCICIEHWLAGDGLPGIISVLIPILCIVTLTVRNPKPETCNGAKRTNSCQGAERVAGKRHPQVTLVGAMKGFAEAG